MAERLAVPAKPSKAARRTDRYPNAGLAPVVQALVTAASMCKSTHRPDVSARAGARLCVAAGRSCPWRYGRAAPC
jgi:hypothetical protein